ncbi:MAG: site-specific integrase [Vicinamibacterales bacterium]
MKRQRNDGLRKRCDCARRSWSKCHHPWWFNFKWQGVHHRYSLDKLVPGKIRAKTEAEGHCDSIRAAIRAGTFRPPGSPVADTPALDRLTLAQLFGTYRSRHLAVKRQATLRNSDYQIAMIAGTELTRTDGERRYFGAWHVTDITTDTIEQYGEGRRKAGVPAANRDLSLLRAAFNWAVRMGAIERTPFKRGTETVVRLTREVGRSRRLEPGEDARLLAACGEHLRAVVEAALETGCRKGELLSLQWAQVRSSPKAEIFLPASKTKTRRDRRVPISARLQLILDMRKLDPEGEAHKPTAYVFGNEVGEQLVTFKRAWERSVLKANGIRPTYVVRTVTLEEGTTRKVPTAVLTPESRAALKAINLHFHDLRREAGSRWLEGGVPLHTVRDWLGHANISQTSTYLEGTIQGQHDAMKAFEERRTREQERATRSETGGQNPPLKGTTGDTAPAKASMKHQAH